MPWTLDAFDPESGELLAEYSSDELTHDFVRGLVSSRMLEVPLEYGDFAVSREMFLALDGLLSPELGFDDASWTLGYSE